MQITHSKGRIVEKVLFDRGGRLVRAKFFVYEREGRIKAKLVDFSFVNQVIGAVSNFLSGFYKKVSKQVTNFFSGLTKSPFFSTEILYSSGSKPRAPTFR